MLLILMLKHVSTMAVVFYQFLDVQPTATNFNPNANTNTANGGAIDNTFSTGGYFNGNQHLIFNSLKIV